MSLGRIKLYLHIFYYRTCTRGYFLISIHLYNTTGRMILTTMHIGRNHWKVSYQILEWNIFKKEKPRSLFQYRWNYLKQFALHSSILILIESLIACSRFIPNPTSWEDAWIIYLFHLNWRLKCWRVAVINTMQMHECGKAVLALRLLFIGNSIWTNVQSA